MNNLRCYNHDVVDCLLCTNYEISAGYMAPPMFREQVANDHTEAIAPAGEEVPASEPEPLPPGLMEAPLLPVGCRFRFAPAKPLAELQAGEVTVVLTEDQVLLVAKILDSTSTSSTVFATVAELDTFEAAHDVFANAADLIVHESRAARRG